VVVGQSATRIYPSLQSFSTQQWQVRVGSRAVLVVLPGPAIPYLGCRFYQRVAIDLAETAGLVWGDIWLAGRYARGVRSEQFQFHMLLQEMTVRREGRMVFRDRFCWQGPWSRPAVDWHFGGMSASSSIFVTGPVVESERFGGNLAAWSLFPTAAGDTCLRCHGLPETVTSATVRMVCRLAAFLSGNRTEREWLVSTDELAPNHWFSLLSSKNGVSRHAAWRHPETMKREGLDLYL
jgi:urease accessory protein